MRARFLSFIASVAIGTLSWIGVANADTIKVFSVNGSFASDEFDVPPLPTPVSLSGTLTIDVTTGVVTVSDLLIPTFAPLNVIDSQETLPNGTGLLYELTVSNTAIGGDGYIDFIIPNEQSNPLIGHNTIDIDQGEFTSQSGTVVFGLTGSITVPEPSTWALMLVGFLGLGFAGYRRRRKLVHLASV